MIQFKRLSIFFPVTRIYLHIFFTFDQWVICQKSIERVGAKMTIISYVFRMPKIQEKTYRHPPHYDQ